MNKISFAVAFMLMMFIISCENQSNSQVRNGTQLHKNIFGIYGLYQAQAKDFDILVERNGDVYQMVGEAREYVGRLEVNPSYFSVRHDGVDLLHIEIGNEIDMIMVTDKSLHIGYSMQKVDWADRLNALTDQDAVRGPE